MGRELKLGHEATAEELGSPAETIVFDVHVDGGGDSRQPTDDESKMVAYLESIQNARLRITIEVYPDPKAN